MRLILKTAEKNIQLYVGCLQSALKTAEKNIQVYVECLAINSQNRREKNKLNVGCLRSIVKAAAKHIQLCVGPFFAINPQNRIKHYTIVRRVFAIPKFVWACKNVKKY